MRPPLAMVALVVLSILLVGVECTSTRVRETSELDYAAFAIAVAPRLAEIETEFQVRWKELEKQGRTVHRSEIDALLRWAESQVLAVLEPRELAPLRDSIRFRFRPQFNHVTPGPSESLKAAAANLHTLSMRAAEGRFSLRLCVISRPGSGAAFRMRPPEYREGIRSGPTILDLRKVALGRYFYKIEERKGEQRVIQCGWKDGGDDDECLDLWDSSGDQLYDCDFDEGLCALRNLRSGECRVS